MQNSKPKYMLIDGNALVHRGFHAIPGLQNKAGEPTGAVYGFVQILFKAIKDIKPTHIACTFDLAGGTFRNELYADYKGTRVKAAQELYDQIPRVKEIVKDLNIPIYEKKGFEADDCLGTLAHKLYKKHEGKCEILILTGDLDTLQLVNHSIKVYTLRKGLSDVMIYDADAVKERYGLTPEQMIDYRALKGDPSDNIKGVKGIGEKTAIELIQEFGSLEKLYSSIKKQEAKSKEKIKPRILDLLIADEESANQSYKLSTIVCDVPLDINVDEYEIPTKNFDKVIKVFQELEFSSLVSKIPKEYLEASSSKLEAGNEITAADIEEVFGSDKEKKDAKYTLVDTDGKAEKLIAKLHKQKEIAVDTETTSIDAIQARLVGVSFSFKAQEGYYVPTNIFRSNLKEFKKILEDKKIKKIGHNIKYDLLVLQSEGIELEGVAFDTMIASYLLNAGTRQHGLDTVAFNELGYRMQPIEELIGKGKKQITMDQVEPEKVSWYASEDADIAFRLKSIFEAPLKKDGLADVFETIEMPLIPALARVEKNGIILDTELLKEEEIEAEKQLHALEKSIYKHAGEEFNINSPLQLKEILFTKLKLSTVMNKKTKTGLSTAAAELEKMLDQHPIIAKIMEYRELAKLQSTYITALPKLVNPQTGRLHTSYNQTIAATGRLSSTDPNLQNIPVRSNRQGIEVRKAFVAAPGYKLVSFDYSQIELRIVAHLSQDKNMLEVFKSGSDIHTSTAMGIFGVKESEVTKDMRRDAKTINFGILYGVSSFGLSYRISELSNADAKQFIDKYFATYPGVKQYLDAVKKEVNANAAVRNELGRIRKFPEIKSSQFFIRAAAERAAINFPIQSLAADVIKVAMLNIDRELRSTKQESGSKGEEIRLLLQVHDELLFEIKEDKVNHYIKILKPLMENAIKLSVPTDTETKIGDNWGEMKKI